VAAAEFADSLSRLLLLLLQINYQQIRPRPQGLPDIVGAGGSRRTALWTPVMSKFKVQVGKTGKLLREQVWPLGSDLRLCP